MKSATHDWHETSLGVAVRWIGSIQVAVPVLVLVALALVVGTYLESTQDAAIAKAMVYGAPWFMGLMALVCVSLIFAALSRLPWQRRHIGFLVVHASLVTLIFAGFWSLFGRVEGRLAVRQGETVGAIETTQETLELVEHDAGAFKRLSEVQAPKAGANLTLAGLPLSIIDRWNNCKEQVLVSDGGAEVYRAVEFAPVRGMPHGYWVGDESHGGPAHIEGMTVRVLAAGATFTPAGPVSEDTVVLHASLEAPKVTLLGVDGTTKELQGDGKFPWTFEFGARSITLHQQLAAAQESSTFTRAPDAKERRPALVVRAGGGPEQVLAWKSSIAVQLPGRPGVLTYGPRRVTLPFALKLEKFNKSDYPGTDMAMSYASDVLVLNPDASESRTSISMNQPLVHAGWKVYQSGFVGTDVSIFSVMRDPGLILTYAGSIGLCIGILVTFYARPLSRGHPGIPSPFAHKESSHGTPPLSADSLAPHNLPRPGQPQGRALDGPPGSPANPGGRTGDAAGLVREEPGIPAHGA